MDESPACFVREKLFERKHSDGNVDQTGDGEHVFCFRRLEFGTALVWDGIESGAFELTSQPDGTPCKFSADLHHIAYWARTIEDGRWHVGMDDRLAAECPAPAHAHLPLTLSADGRRTAYAARLGHRLRLVVDGAPLTEFEPAALHPVFSPDGERVAFVAKGQHAERLRVVVDGVPGPEFDNIASSTIFGKEVPSLTFSADSRHFVYGARRGDKWVIVLDDVCGPEFDKIGWTVLSPDGRRLAYVAGQGLSWTAVVDGELGPWYERVGPAVFSPDSRHVAYAVVEASAFGPRVGKHRMVVNGEPGLEFDAIHWVGRSAIPNGYSFSPDSKRLAYLARRKKGFLRRKWLLVLDGEAGPEFDEISPNLAQPDALALASQPYFSPDSKHVAFAAQLNDLWSIVLDGAPGEGFYLVQRPVFSADSNHIAYLAKGSAGPRVLVVVDGEPGPELENMYTPYESYLAPFRFSPEGAHVAYNGQVEGRWYPIVDGHLGPASDGISFPSFTADGRPRFTTITRDAVNRVTYSPSRG